PQAKLVESVRGRGQCRPYRRAGRRAAIQAAWHDDDRCRVVSVKAILCRADMPNLPGAAGARGRSAPRQLLEQYRDVPGVRDDDIGRLAETVGTEHRGGMPERSGPPQVLRAT